MFVISIRRIDK